MQIEILLDPRSPNYADFVADLDEELRALKGLEYKQIEAPAPPNTLNLEHDIVKLVFEHGADVLKIIVTLIQLTQAVADRWKKPEDGKKGEQSAEPVAILKVDDRSVAFPASDRAQRGLLKAVREGKTKKPKKKAQKKAVPKKKHTKASRK
jgi:hypothetical protein